MNNTDIEKLKELTELKPLKLTELETPEELSRNNEILNFEQVYEDITDDTYHQQQTENTQSDLYIDEYNSISDLIEQNEFIHLILELEKDLSKDDFIKVILLFDNNNNLKYHIDSDQTLKEYIDNEKIKQISEIFNNHKELSKYVCGLLLSTGNNFLDIENKETLVQKIVLYDIFRKYNDKLKLVGLACLEKEIRNKNLNYKDYYLELDFLIDYYKNIYKEKYEEGLGAFIIFLAQTISKKDKTDLSLIKKMLYNIYLQDEDKAKNILNNIELSPSTKIFESFEISLEDFKFFIKLGLKYEQLVKDKIKYPLFFSILSTSNEKDVIIDYLINECNLDLNTTYNGSKIETLLEYSVSTSNFDLFKILFEKGAIIDKRTLEVIFQHFNKLEKFFDYLENNYKQGILNIFKSEIILLENRKNLDEYISMYENNILTNKIILDKIFTYLSSEEKYVFYKNIALEEIIEVCDLELFIDLLDNNVLIRNNIDFFSNLIKNKNNSVAIFDYILNNKREILDAYLKEYSKSKNYNKEDLITLTLFSNNIDFAKKIIQHNIIKITKTNFEYASDISFMNKTAKFVVNEYNKQIYEAKMLEQLRIEQEKQEKEQLKIKREQEQKDNLLKFKQNFIIDLNTIVKQKNIINNEITINDINEDLINKFVLIWNSFTSLEQQKLYNGFRLFEFNNIFIDNLLNMEQTKFIKSVLERYNINANINTPNELINLLAKIDDVFIEDNIVIDKEIYDKFYNLFRIKKEDLDNNLKNIRNNYNINRETDKRKKLYAKNLELTLKDKNIRFKDTVNYLNECVNNLKYMVGILDFCKTITNDIGFQGDEFNYSGYEKYGEDIYNFFINLDGIFSLFQQSNSSGLNKQLNYFKQKNNFFVDMINKIQDMEYNYINISNLSEDELTNLQEEFNNFNIRIIEIKNTFNDLILNFNKIFQNSKFKFDFKFEQNSDNIKNLCDLILQKFFNYLIADKKIKIESRKQFVEEYKKEDHFTLLIALMNDLKNRIELKLPNNISRNLRDNTTKPKTIQVRQNRERKKVIQKIDQEKEIQHQKKTVQRNKEYKTNQVKKSKTIQVPSIKSFIEKLSNDNFKISKFNIKNINQNDAINYHKTILLNSLIDLFNEKNDKSKITELLNTVVSAYDKYINLKNDKKQYKDDTILKRFKKIKFFELIISNLQVDITVEELDIQDKIIRAGYENILYAVKKKRNEFVYNKNITEQEILENTDINIISMLDCYVKHKSLLNKNEKQLQKIRNAYFLKIYQNIVDLDINITNMIDNYKNINVPIETKRYYVIQSLPDNNITKIMYNEFRELRNKILHHFYDINEIEFDLFINKLMQFQLSNKEQLETLEKRETIIEEYATEIKPEPQPENTVNSINLTNSNVNRNIVLNMSRNIRGNSTDFISLDNAFSNQNEIEFSYGTGNTPILYNRNNVELINLSGQNGTNISDNINDHDGSYIVSLPNHFVAVRRITRDNQTYFFGIDSLNSGNNALEQIILDRYPDVRFINLQTDTVQQNPNTVNGDVADRNACAIWAYTNAIALNQIDSDELINSINGGVVELPQINNEILLTNLNNLTNADNDFNNLIGNKKDNSLNKLEKANNKQQKNIDNISSANEEIEDISAWGLRFLFNK